VHLLRTTAFIAVSVPLAFVVARNGVNALEPFVAPGAVAVLFGTLAQMFGPDIRRAVMRGRATMHLRERYDPTEYH
jgi:hypothetical protein